MGNISSTYIQYGVPNKWAEKFEVKNLTVSNFRSLKKKELVTKYKISENHVDLVKHCIKRQPVDEDTIQLLLENSNFTCCLCKDKSGQGYIIHHIKEYAASKDNSYSNLAVLCPNHHDLAHRTGIALTNRITPDQIKKAKIKWEKAVEDHNVKIVLKDGKLRDLDFVNIPRILELCYEVFGNIPATDHTALLLREKLIKKDNSLNLSQLKGITDNVHTPLMFFGPYGSTALRRHYFELLKLCINKLDFQDIDDLLSKRKVLSSGFIGTYCFYVGGLYGNRPARPITSNTPPVHVYFRRRGYFVEWSVDPTYLTGSTAISRLSERTIYAIYGVIRSVNNIERDGKQMIRIDVRPFAFGSPIKHKTRLR